MKTFRINAFVTISIHTEVEAKTKSSALKIAKDRALVGLCASCGSGNPEDEWCTCGELDGEPQNIEIEEDDLGDDA